MQAAASLQFPDEFQVNDKLRDELFSEFNLNKDKYNLDFPQKILKDYLISQDIPFLDMLDVFKTEGKKVELYKFRDTHWNAKGEQLASDLLFDYIREQSMIKFTD